MQVRSTPEEQPRVVVLAVEFEHHHAVSNRKTAVLHLARQRHQLQAHSSAFSRATAIAHRIRCKMSIKRGRRNKVRGIVCLLAACRLEQRRGGVTQRE